MPLDTAGRNTAAGAVSDAYPWVALFNGDPGSGGTEISGGSPAYARIPKTGWTEANGTSSMPSSALFNVPAGATVTYWAVFTASTGGTRGGYGTCTSAGPYGSQGTYELTSATITVT